MKLNYILIGGFLIIALLVGVVGYFGFHAGNQTKALYSDLTKNFVPYTKAAIEITSYSKRAEGHLLLYLALDDQTDRDKFFIRIDSLKQEISILDNLVITPKGKDIVNQLSQQTIEVKRFGELLLAEHDKDPEGFEFKDHKELIKEFHDITSDIRKKGVELAEQEAEEVINIINNAKDSISDIQTKVIVIVGFGLILTIVLGFSTSYLISKPLTKLTNSVDKVSKGNFKTEIETQGKIDEVNKLADSLNRIMKTMKLAVLEKKMKK